MDLLRSKPITSRRKRVDVNKNPLGVPPIGAPSWCLNEEALRKFGRPTNNIPIYDHNTDSDHDSNTSNDEISREGDNEKKKRKKSKKSKSK